MYGANMKTHFQLTSLLFIVSFQVIHAIFVMIKSPVCELPCHLKCTIEKAKTHVVLLCNFETISPLHFCHGKGIRNIIRLCVLAEHIRLQKRIFYASLYVAICDVSGCTISFHIIS